MVSFPVAARCECRGLLDRRFAKSSLPPPPRVGVGSGTPIPLDFFQSNSTSIHILDAHLTAVALYPPVFVGELPLEIVRKQDEERESAWDPTGDCADGDSGHDL